MPGIDGSHAGHTPVNRTDRSQWGGLPVEGDSKPPPHTHTQVQLGSRSGEKCEAGKGREGVMGEVVGRVAQPFLRLVRPGPTHPVLTLRCCSPSCEKPARPAHPLALPAPRRPLAAGHPPAPTRTHRIAPALPPAQGRQVLGGPPGSSRGGSIGSAVEKWTSGLFIFLLYYYFF